MGCEILESVILGGRLWSLLIQSDSVNFRHFIRLLHLLAHPSLKLDWSKCFLLLYEVDSNKEQSMVIEICNSQCGQICGYLNLETGTMNRQDRSFYKPGEKTGLLKNLASFFENYWETHTPNRSSPWVFKKQILFAVVIMGTATQLRMCAWV